jgi:transposase
VRFLPPCSHDFNPIEAARALIKKRIGAVAPRTAATLRHTARNALDTPFGRDIVRTRSPMLNDELNWG